MAVQKRSRPQQLTLCRSLHAEALKATASEGLAQGPCVEARAEFEPTTLRSKGIDSTNAPPRPILCPFKMVSSLYMYDPFATRRDGIQARDTDTL